MTNQMITEMIWVLINVLSGAMLTAFWLSAKEKLEVLSWMQKYSKLQNEQIATLKELLDVRRQLKQVQPRYLAKLEGEAKQEPEERVH